MFFLLLYYLVSIPFKSGKYSNGIYICVFYTVYKFVSIPFKSGKYSNTVFHKLFNLLIYIDSFS